MAAVTAAIEQLAQPVRGKGKQAKSSYSFPRVFFSLVPHISANTIKKIHPKCAQRLFSWRGPDLVKLKTVVAMAVVDILMFGCEPSLCQMNHLSSLVLAS